MVDLPQARDGHISERFMLCDGFFFVEGHLLEDWALRQRQVVGRLRASALS